MKRRKAREWWVAIWDDGEISSLYNSQAALRFHINPFGVTNYAVIKVREILPRRKAKGKGKR